MLGCRRTRKIQSASIVASRTHPGLQSTTAYSSALIAQVCTGVLASALVWCAPSTSICGQRSSFSRWSKEAIANSKNFLLSMTSTISRMLRLSTILWHLISTGDATLCYLKARSLKKRCQTCTLDVHYLTGEDSASTVSHWTFPRRSRNN